MENVGFAVCGILRTIFVEKIIFLRTPIFYAFWRDFFPVNILLQNRNKWWHAEQKPRHFIF